MEPKAAGTPPEMVCWRYATPRLYSGITHCFISNILIFKLAVSIHTVSCVAQYKFQARPIGQQKNPEVEINL